ncbi:hypothetical protein BYZ73_01315 [Rhodovulum viride]|uniref:Uncharacterized protein n=1 Tax=Rhodovulum viride TaxID=1231134 RepID=A0ABX9DLV6_9RHOB|nr:hypothetical protein BYZ73_01315 [Rhodovulum viride]
MPTQPHEIEAYERKPARPPPGFPAPGGRCCARLVAGWTALWTPIIWICRRRPRRGARLAEFGLTAAPAGTAALTGTLSVLRLPVGLRLARRVAPAQEIRPGAVRSRSGALLAVLTLRSRGVLSVGSRVQ